VDYVSIIQKELSTGTANNPAVPVNLIPLVIAQAQHESANFTSNVFLNSNNPFGYTYANSSYQIGDYEGFGTYESVADAANEINDYLYRRVADSSFPALDTITTADQYAQLLADAGYYADSEANYAAGIQKWLDIDGGSPLAIAEEFVEENPVPSIVGVIGFGIALYFIFSETS